MAFLSLVSLAVGLFIELTWRLKEGLGLEHLDRFTLALFEKLRFPDLNEIMVELTALGSSTLVLIFCLVGILILGLARDRRGAVFLLSSVAGSGIGSTVIKHWVHRERPSVSLRLVNVTGFSYPSGHTLLSTSLFFSLAFLACRSFKDWRSRIVLFSLAAFLAGLIGFSRIYLGVHYPSDVLSGIFLGIAWTFGLATFLFRPGSGD